MVELEQILYLLGALLGIGAFLFVVRRASDKQLGEGPTRRELKEAEEVEEVEAGEAARPARPKRPARPTRKPKRKPTRAKPAREAEPEAEAEEAEEAELEPALAEAEEAADLRDGLAKTRGGFVAKLGRLFSKKQIGENVLDELESVLFTADIGPKTAQKLFEAIKSDLSRDQLDDPDAIWSKIRDESATILDVKSEPLDFGRHQPFVLLVIGVNGAGKTTTIGKVAAKLTGEGKKVLLAAGDTFRAAAVEQLEIWGQRAGAPVVKGKSGGDPSSVIFDAIKRGVDEGYDVVIADTAGRLQTKVELMEELKKVRRVADKAMPGCPHETWLVLDSTTGQNAIQQAQIFKQAMEITGIVLTKLDGTAKGGVILGICDEMNVPVRYIGIGEKVADLREFDPRAFVDALYEQGSSADAA